ncbi:MAG TPA: 30S ribosomal protein S17 [Patescibacteria group bacterium]
MTNTTKKLARKKGTVVSDKMDKTIVVAVETLKTHPKYLKKYRSTKKYKVHDGENKFKVGDVVEFVQCRPMSKDKQHTVIYE